MTEPGKRAAQRPALAAYRGPAAEFAQACLRRQFPEQQAQNPVAFDLWLRKRWQMQLADSATHNPVAAPMFARAAQCCSGVLCSHKATRVVTCKYAWFCPSCYARSLVTLYHRLERTPDFSLSYWKVDSPPGTLGLAWRQLDMRVQEQAKTRESRIIWRWFDPFASEARLVLIRPSKVFDNALFELTDLLAYPRGWLYEPPQAVAVHAEMTRGFRGRIYAGIYRKEP